MCLMSRRDNDNARGGRAAAAGNERRPRRIILIISQTGIISERLISALEREFSWVLVEEVEQVAAACNVFAHPVSLILVDPGMIDEADEKYIELLRLHPDALAAAIEPDDENLAASFLKLTRSPLVRSVLPMNLRLDTWLSVIGLMLCGGDYLPPALILGARRNGHGPGGGAKLTGAPINGAGVSELTTRELQILEMVSRGLQNKLIAAEFRLSEHTVKIHLHNIITKLGAHNRTEAVARFRSLQEGL
ncbi:response regulator transcription factor [Sinorhizobium meliloti]|uniref:response regulator transcription factor n=1 Tax=Rhizobium meliloti TaxID=382 RepID=UPI0018DF3C70|nr:response regulator transcription factor [Sinorhizobium meliloti]